MFGLKPELERSGFANRCEQQKNVGRTRACLHHLFVPHASITVCTQVKNDCAVMGWLFIFLVLHLETLRKIVQNTWSGLHLCTVDFQNV
jgi:hypothetical protein